MPQKPGLKRDLAAERAARRAATQNARLVPQGLPTVRPDQLMPSPENGREKLLKIDELADTLRSDGMNTAVTVIPPDVYVERYPQHREAVEARVAEGVLFVVHHGHRRLAAAIKAGLTEVPILVRREVPSLRIAAIQENLQRMALNPIEEAREFQDALDEKDDAGKHLSQRELAKRVGCSQTYVSHRIALLRLIPALRQAVVDHWLKEQGLLEPAGDEDDAGVFRPLLPVREAATVFARLRVDLQEAYARGELTSAEAASISKMPTEQQDIPARDGERGDCAAISESGSTEVPLPEPRTGDASAPDISREGSGRHSDVVPSPSPAPTDVPSTAPQRSPQPPAPAASVATSSEPRGVIVVRDVEELALSILDLLDQQEVEELKALLSV